MKDDVTGILNHFKPFFHAHGGDFTIQEVTDDGKVKVKLTGECVLCQLKEKTAEGMEMALKNAVPGFSGVEIVDG